MKTSKKKKKKDSIIIFFCTSILFTHLVLMVEVLELSLKLVLLDTLNMFLMSELT